MDEEVNFEFVSSLDSNESSQESSQKMPAFPEDMKLAGWLKLSGLGLLKTVKHVWFQYGDDTGKLYYYLQPQDRLPLGEIDLRNSSLSYDAWNKDRPGLFEVRSGGKVYSIDAQERSRMLYWLDALQKKRRAFSLKQFALTQDFIMGKKRNLSASGLLGQGSADPDGLPSHNLNVNKDQEPEECHSENLKQSHYWSSHSSVVTEIVDAVSIQNTMADNEKPDNNSLNIPNEDWSIIDSRPVPPNSLFLVNNLSTSTDESVMGLKDAESPSTQHEYRDESQHFDIYGDGPDHSLNLNDQMNSPQILTAVESRPQPLDNARFPVSPVINGRSKFISALRNNFKIMKDTMRERKMSASMKRSFSSQNPGNSTDNSHYCNGCKMLSSDLQSAKEDLKRAEEELQSKREIVGFLQIELDVAKAEMNTRKDCAGKSEQEIMQILEQKDKHIVKLDHIRTTLLCEKSNLTEELSLKDDELKNLKEQIFMFQQTLAVKDEIIISLASENEELRNHNRYSFSDLSESSCSSLSFLNSPASPTNERKEIERLTDMCKAYEDQNKFLTNEILELTALRQDDEARERLLKIHLAKAEARYYQTRSKYLFLLNEKQTPVRGGDENKNQDVVSQLLQEALESEIIESQDDYSDDTEYDDDVNGGSFVPSRSRKEYDCYGFLKLGYEDGDLLVSRANILQRRSEEIGYKIRDAEDEISKRIKWENFMVGMSPNKQFVRSPDIKMLIRLGIPREFRERIWKGCIGLYVRSAQVKLGVNYYKDLQQRAYNNKSNPAIKQIELDLLRTLPNNKYFDQMDCPGIRKLRKILLCYSIHNPFIGYCQGINRLAAIALLFLCEEDAFWCLVAITEHLMPADYYTTTLAAAQADQRVLKDLVQDKCPKLYAHLNANDVDLSLFTFNWFLTVFVDGIQPELFLRVWDVFLYEGSKVLFRFALAFLKYAEDEILKQPSNLAINKYMRMLGETITDVKRIYNIAFSELNPFPMRSISNKRHYHLQQVKLELEDLEKMRKDLRSAQDTEEQLQNRQGYISEDDLDD